MLVVATPKEAEPATSPTIADNQLSSFWRFFRGIGNVPIPFFVFTLTLNEYAVLHFYQVKPLQRANRNLTASLSGRLTWVECPLSR